MSQCVVLSVSSDVITFHRRGRKRKAEKRKNPEETGILVMLTDGKANFDTREGKPWSLALKAAEELKRKGVPVLVIDTENSVFGMGLARQLSDAAGGKYVKL